MYMLYQREMKMIGESQKFTIKPVPTASPDTDFDAVVAFQQNTSELSRKIGIANSEMNTAREKLKYIKAALMETPKASPALFQSLDELQIELAKLQKSLTGDPIRQKFSESNVPSISARVGQVIYGHWSTRQTPTETQRRNIQLAEEAFIQFSKSLASYFDEFALYEKQLEEVGAPWTPGRKMR
jgi:hypothetical protein